MVGTDVESVLGLHVRCTLLAGRSQCTPYARVAAMGYEACAVRSENAGADNTLYYCRSSQSVASTSQRTNHSTPGEKTSIPGLDRINGACPVPVNRDERFRRRCGSWQEISSGKLGREETGRIQRKLSEEKRGSTGRRQQGLVSFSLWIRQGAAVQITGVGCRVRAGKHREEHGFPVGYRGLQYGTVW